MKLNQLLTTESRFQVGSYGQEIHEMTESVTLAIGQYAHNNQPVHHILYLFAILGDSHTTQKMTRDVLNRGYGIDFYSGDEDNGEQGAWFVLSALGLFSAVPGTLDYVFSSPLFRHVRISRSDSDLSDFESQPSNQKESGDYLDLFALGIDQNNHINDFTDKLYVEKLLINNTIVVDKSFNFMVSDRLLQQKGTVRFVYEFETKDPTLIADGNNYIERVHKMSTAALDTKISCTGSAGNVDSRPNVNKPLEENKNANISLKKRIEEQNQKIKVLEQLLKGNGIKVETSNGQSGSFLGSFAVLLAGYPLIGILFVVFLAAFCIARLLEGLGVTQSAPYVDDVVDLSSKSSRGLFCFGFLRPWFLFFRSQVKLYFADPSSAVDKHADSWSRKPQAYTV